MARPFLPPPAHMPPGGKLERQFIARLVIPFLTGLLKSAPPELTCAIEGTS